MAAITPDWLSAKEATRILGVKVQTLYAYASRGLLTSVPNTRGRGRRYSADDVATLKNRHDARAGHGAVAASALRWGEPVLETRISEVRSDGPRFRGHAALDLASQGNSFEQVSELLFCGKLPSSEPRWGALPASLVRQLPRFSMPEQPIPGLATLLSWLALAPGLNTPVPDELEHERARGILLFLTDRLREGRGRESGSPKVAERLLEAYGVPARPQAVQIVDRALTLCADHELDASTFAARIAASTGASLCASLAAAMHTLSGPRHGGACARVEALLDEASTHRKAGDVVAARLARGEALPGFGHPLYPQGDPRARALLALADEVKRPPAQHLRMRALIAAARQAGQPEPTLDAGLIAVTSALGMPHGAASAIFSIGRTAGWVAHILEQRAQATLLRPRARYVG